MVSENQKTQKAASRQKALAEIESHDENESQMASGERATLG